MSRRVVSSSAVLCAVLLGALVAGSARSQDASEPASTSGEPADDALAAAERMEGAFARVSQKVAPSLVAVTSYARASKSADEGGVDEGDARSAWVELVGEPYPGFRPVVAGSGIMMSDEGYLVTARHIVLKPDGEPADLIGVETHDYRRSLAKLVAAEPTLNVAVLKLLDLEEQGSARFEPATLGDSDAAAVGSWAIALGDPQGPIRFFNVGVLSARPDRECYQEQLTATYLQAALKVHPECYGGPLANVRGEVIGLLTPRLPAPGVRPEGADDGLEFALPINIVRTIYDALREKESTRSPWLGYAVASPAELRRKVGPDAFRAMKRPPLGLYIENVFDPSPAHAAGVRPGDFLVKLDGQFVRSPLEFQKMLYMAGVGATVALTMFREGETYEVEVVVELRPENATLR